MVTGLTVFVTQQDVTVQIKCHFYEMNTFVHVFSVIFRISVIDGYFISVVLDSQFFSSTLYRKLLVLHSYMYCWRGDFLLSMLCKSIV